MDKEMEVKPLTGNNEVLEPVKVSEEEVKKLMDSLEGFSMEKMTKTIAETFGITEQEAQRLADKHGKTRESHELKVEDLNVGKDDNTRDLDDEQTK